MFSGGKPGKPLNIERVWFCMFSCICTHVPTKAEAALLAVARGLVKP